MKKIVLHLSTAITTLLLLYTQVATAEVLLIKQWHLGSEIDTSDVAKSEKLEQYDNQQQIYHLIKSKILRNELKIILAEGCGPSYEINESFEKKYNGWNFKSLKEIKNKTIFDKVLTLIPLKLKAEFDTKIKVYCADNEELIKQHLQTISDLSFYISHLQKLQEFEKSSPQNFIAYENSFWSKVTSKREKNTLEFLRKTILSKISEFERLTNGRNKEFSNAILQFKNENVALVVGGLHTSGIQQNLKKEKIESTEIIPKGYPLDGDTLIEDIKKLIIEKKPISPDMI